MVMRKTSDMTIVAKTGNIVDMLTTRIAMSAHKAAVWARRAGQP
jgi:hypothetical protein